MCILLQSYKTDDQRVFFLAVRSLASYNHISLYMVMSLGLKLVNIFCMTNFEWLIVMEYHF